VAGLLYAHLQSGAPTPAPAFVAELRAVALGQAGTELGQRAELARLAEALAEAGVAALLMKGASVAYDVYSDPAWRVRADTDVMIRERDRALTGTALAALGYREDTDLQGQFASHQAHYVRVETSGVRHLVDVHWKIANPQRFANAVTFDELTDLAIPLPTVGPSARGLGRVHALWLACVHRAAHHYDRESLVWLYDVHLLVETLDESERAAFSALVERTKVRRICRRALDLAVSLFGTRVAGDVLEALSAPEGSAAPEPSAAFLNRDMRLVDVLRDDLRALPTWRARLTLLKEHVFPTEAYLRTTYAPGSTAPRPWLCLTRLVRGVPRWIRY
jgi:hypothetical protein